MAVIAALAEQAPAIAELRRDIHAHPELGFQEHRTATRVADCLAAWGIPIERELAPPAVVGVVHGRDGGRCGRAIGLRADMDALPIEEANTFAHRSRHARTMHACGHDGHTAMLLAAAQHLATHRDFDGTAYLIFQPAEEGGGGARTMVEQGLFERYPMEAVFGLHNWPGYPAGAIAVSPGPVMASANTFKIVVQGQGSHAALPHESIDPVPLACQIVQALHSIVSRNLRPIDTAVLSVTMIHAGEATNVVPATCTIGGTVRTFRVEVLDTIEQRARQIALATCAAHGARCDFEFLRRAPPVVNHRHEAEFAAAVAASVAADSSAPPLRQEPAMASEDFAFMLEVKAGCYAFIGNGDGAHRAQGHGEGPCMLHNPSYDFNDELIAPGATYWVRLVERWLGASAASPRKR